MQSIYFHLLFRLKGEMADRKMVITEPDFMLSYYQFGSVCCIQTMHPKPSRPLLFHLPFILKTLTPLPSSGYGEEDVVRGGVMD